ncbi:AbrB/MazE/SpoVT family DNA-binding domain-containing protein [Virgibacillus sediminis]|uniref:AbrB/MazE/SpoVT family DNA-binding domain-containing protein n=1 Tax=Virgibacillus sediminis TaxID=202260 RepID=A0ABV7A3W5_9BACI
MEHYESVLQQEGEHIETESTCRLTTRYSITIPKRIRETLDLKSHEEVSISFRSKPSEVFIQKIHQNNSGENTMVMDSRGGIRIPAEVQRFLNLKKGDKFSLFIINNDKLMLKKR